MKYEGNIYRPPTEAYSLIVQITIGCSHNGCIFCGMFKDKKFRIRPIDEVMEEFKEARSTYPHIGQIFLADGDALIYQTEDLIRILDYIKTNIPECKHVTSYATPRSLLLKSQEELDTLHQKGLDILYLGMESGSDEVLKYMNKGATADEITLAGQKAKKAGFQLVVMILSGLGGKKLWKEHAIYSGKVLTAMKPDSIAEMTLNIIPGTKLYEKVQSGEFEVLTPNEILQETKMLIKHIDIDGCEFITNHVSNYVNIQGVFNEGKPQMLAQLDDAIKNGNIKERKRTNL
jgi:radical SAM superfamily enzyme YgiQ (UPF0313 family)